jgi:hypothetical protein
MYGLSIKNSVLRHAPAEKKPETHFCISGS